MRRSMTPRGFMLALASVVLLAGGGIAYATGSSATRSSSGDINGCYNQISGQLRIDAVCKPGEMTVSWQRNGQPGPPGSTGPAGPAGRDGRDGRDGLNGRDGINGLNGLNGRDGQAGPAGAPGAQGPSGPGGPAGQKGDTGAAGPAGSTGPAGGGGTQGPEGPAGQPGPVGPAGPQGLQGQQGPQGQSAFARVGRFGFSGRHETTASTGGFVKALDLGSFTKERTGSTERVDVHGVGLDANAFFCIWQVRVDDAAEGSGSGVTLLHGPTNAASAMSGIFTSLPAGVHTVSIWVDQRGEGSCVINPGNFNYEVIVQEVL